MKERADMTNNTVGKNIKAFRIKCNMTQDELARKMCMTRQTLSNYEIGKRIPDIYSLCSMADAFGISIDEIANHKVEVN